MDAQEPSPIRVAQVMGKMLYGGTESVVMNYYRHIDRTKIQFDFIADSDSTMPIPRQNEIESLGGRVFIVPPYQKLQEYIPALIKLFREQNYQIVHAHISTLNVFPLYAAQKAGVPIRISHSHTTVAPGEWKKNILKYMLRPFAKVYATHYAACSGHSGKWLFGRRSMECGKVKIFNNAIDLKKFQFNPIVRDEVRRELGIEDKFVIGHVGRFCYDKNHEFLIDVFEKVYEKNPNAVLLLVGDGKERKRIEEKIDKIKLRGGVIFLGIRTDIDRLYQAFDVFILPSKIEGFPVVGVEAQANGLSVIFSKNVPKEALITEQAISLSLESGAEQWALAIIALKEKKRKFQKVLWQYDITVQAGVLVNYYGGCLNEITEQPGKKIV